MVLMYRPQSEREPPEGALAEKRGCTPPPQGLSGASGPESTHTYSKSALRGRQGGSHKVKAITPRESAQPQLSARGRMLPAHHRHRHGQGHSAGLQRLGAGAGRARPPGRGGAGRVLLFTKYTVRPHRGPISAYVHVHLYIEHINNSRARARGLPSLECWRRAQPCLHGWVWWGRVGCGTIDETRVP